MKIIQIESIFILHVVTFFNVVSLGEIFYKNIDAVFQTRT